MHAHVAAEECLGGDGQGQAGGIEQSRQDQPERQTAQSHRARGGAQCGLPGQLFQQGIARNFHRAGS
jgi:hypothetical protein